jgi:6-hydroxynicotinate 3-monooxygenase
MPRVAIVGGGLGGTVAAILLQRAGFPVAVYEQAPKIERIGAGINLGPHIMRIMHHLGIDAAMKAIGVVPRERWRRVWDTGEITLRQPVESFADIYGADHLIIHRGDFQAILTGAMAPGALQLGKRLVEAENRGPVVRLAFDDGSAAEAEIVIGADGINSRTRDVVLDPEPPSYTGHVAYRSIFPVALLDGLHVPDHTKWFKDECHILIYFITREREVIYFVTGNPEPWNADSYAPQRADLAAMRDAFAGYHPEVLQVLNACPEASRWPILERLPRPGWSKGRIVLLGDACHPMRPHMGQGAAMAIEDAVVLARCLEKFDGDDLPDAFSLYEALRYERASNVQLSSQHNMWLKDAKEDPGWLYRHNVLTLPLETPAPTSPQRSAALT